ncbi:MAG: NYN domain-containing protein [Candidatus Sungbacteria bacterium]|nr:NYN domain-containing protein [Candidatus Sungbacteria bacterium]
MNRVSVFIDSGNFYHLVLKKLNLPEVEFDFDGFAKLLSNGRQIAQGGKRFYVGTVREMQDGHESKRAMENQTKLFSELIKSKDWTIKTSKLRTRTERIKIDDRVANYKQILSRGINEIQYTRSREKGIDVKIAVDLIAGALDDKYDTAIIVSSDADLIPAIDWVRKRLKKKIEYIGFSMPQTDLYESTKPTKTMIYNSDVQRVLVESDLKPFIKKTTF